MNMQGRGCVTVASGSWSESRAVWGVLPRIACRWAKRLDQQLDEVVEAKMKKERRKERGEEVSKIVPKVRVVIRGWKR